MDWIEKLKRRWTRFYLRTTLVPFDGASLQEWQNFARIAPRWLVEETVEKWLEDVCTSSYWAYVYDALKWRVNSFEHPRVDQAFYEAHKSMICEVSVYADGASIRQTVEQATLSYPFFIMDNNKRFRGLALGDNFIIAGVVNTASTSSEERRLQEWNNSQSLSLKDVEQLQDIAEEVSRMLMSVGAGSLQGRYWYRDYGSVKVWDFGCARQIQEKEAFVIGKL